MIPKKTKIRQDGSVWSVVNEETNEVIKSFPTQSEAERYKSILGLGLPVAKDLHGKVTLGSPSTHIFVDSDGVVYPSADEGPAYHVTAPGLGKPYPYFGDPTKPMDQSKPYTLGNIDPMVPWKHTDEPFTLEKLKEAMSKIHDHKITSATTMGTDIRVEDFLRTIPMKEMLNAMFWQMANKAGHLGVLRPTEDQYQEICNYIFDNYVNDLNKSQHAPHNRQVDDTKGMKSALTTLIRKLQEYRGIRNAKVIYEDFPSSATITLTIDSAFEFDDEEHMHSWESNLTRLFKEHKPAKLNRLEVMFSRMEVF